MAYGKELILDLYGCDASKFNRPALRKFFKELCELIDMNREELHFWDYEGFPEEKAAAPPHLKGTTAIQFLSTSNITIHALDIGEFYINLFTCKEFNVDAAVKFISDWLGNDDYDLHTLQRGRRTGT